MARFESLTETAVEIQKPDGTTKDVTVSGESATVDVGSVAYDVNIQKPDGTTEEVSVSGMSKNIKFEGSFGWKTEKTHTVSPTGNTTTVFEAGNFTNNVDPADRILFTAETAKSWYDPILAYIHGDSSHELLVQDEELPISLYKSEINKLSYPVTIKFYIRGDGHRGDPIGTITAKEQTRTVSISSVTTE